MYEKVFLGITKTTSALANFQKFFLKLFKERGVRGVWFKKWFTQESTFTIVEDIRV